MRSLLQGFHLRYLCFAIAVWLVATGAHSQNDLLGNRRRTPFSIKPLTFELGGGVNLYYGDVQSSGGGSGLALSGAANSNFHPKWGIYGEGTYGKLKGSKPVLGGTATERLDGTFLSADARVVYQFFRLSNSRKARFSKQTVANRFQLFPGLGLGLAMASSTVFSTASGTEEVGRSIRRQVGAFAVLSLNTRLMLTSNFSIGTEAAFRSFFTDQLDATAGTDSAGDIFAFIGVKVGYTFEKNRL